MAIAKQIKNIVKAIPQLQQLVDFTNQQGQNSVRQNLQTNLEYAPQFAALENALYSQYGPGAAATGNAISNQTALGNAQTDVNLLNGPGGQAALDADKLQRQIDPEFYGMRTDVVNAIKPFLSGELSGGEQAQIERTLNRRDVNRGTLSAPSNTATVANAMTFGNASKDRILQGLTQAQQFLQTGKSGLDAYKIATGKSGQTNPGELKVQNADIAGSTKNPAGDWIQGLLGGASNANIAAMNQPNVLQQLPDYS